MTNNGEKKTLEVDLPARTYERLQDYSRNTDKSVKNVVNDAINNEITKCQVKEILADKCSSEELPKDSRICKAIDEGHHV